MYENHRYPVASLVCRRIVQLAPHSEFWANISASEMKCIVSGRAINFNTHSLRLLTRYLILWKCLLAEHNNDSKMTLEQLNFTKT